MVFLIVQCLRRSDDDALSCVDAHRVEIFHIAYSDRVVETIPYDFIFDLLPSGQVFLDEDLRSSAQCFFGAQGQFLLIADFSRA